MEKKINIAELLKDCPRGMELNCTSYNNVSFDKISSDKKAPYPIFCYITDEKGNRSSISFTEDGCESKRYGAKCVIFPKGKTTWEGFQRPFKNGDIIYNRLQQKICICYLCEDVIYINHCRYNELKNIVFEKLDTPIPIAIQDYRLATEDEKQKLFQAIENNGYKWNEKTKTLETLLEPTFKNGDILTTARGNIFIYKGLMYYSKNLADFYCGYIISDKTFTLKLFKDRYFGNVTECRFATEEERQELFQAIKDNGYKWDDKNKILEKVIKPKFKVGDKIVNDGYVVEIIDMDIEGEVYGYKSKVGGTGGILFIEQDEWELADKFDVTTLKPYDKVLVRDSIFGRWKIEFFEKFDKGLKFPFICMNGKYSICIPYENNKHLHDTINPCSDYYQI